jgi:hypothetical protein
VTVSVEVSAEVSGLTCKFLFLSGEFKGKLRNNPFINNVSGSFLLNFPVLNLFPARA